jgi:hypothetical protein
MIKSILLYDNEDDTLGDFFNLCANSYQLLSINHSGDNLIVEHKSDNSNKHDVETSVSKYNNENFLFISFLHGDEETMYISKDKIISIDNSYFFSNAFCYTFSCYCGNTLAKSMITNAAHVFWGYKDKVYSIIGCEDDFMQLTLSGLNHFFMNDTVEIAYNKVKKEFNDKIDSLYKTNFFIASTLLHNRESMIVHGRTDISISDFIQ